MGGTRAEILFPEAEQDDGKAAEDPINDEAKVRARAEKYGVPLSEKALARPKPGLLRDDMRKAKALQRSDGIASFNLYSDAELAKQSDRAARFGTTPAAAPVIAVAGPSEEEEAKKARAAKFGLEYQEPDTSGLDKAMLMEERREAEEVGAARPDALHVYGVDLVGSTDLLRFFQLYGPTYVEWIDDSSCNVLFPDEFTVKRVIVQMGEALPAQEVAEIDAIKPADETVKHLWYRAKSALMRDGVAVPLLFRIAVTSDCKDYLKRGKTRRLWTMPVRKAISVAQGKEPAPAPKRHGGGREAPPAPKPRGRGKGGQQNRAPPEHGALRGKRERVDEEGDVVMSGPQGRGRAERGGKSRRRREDAMDTDMGFEFLRDDRRADGAQSYFLNLDEAGGEADAPAFEGAAVALAQDDKARALHGAAADVKEEAVDVKAEPAVEVMQIDD